MAKATEYDASQGQPNDAGRGDAVQYTGAQATGPAFVQTHATGQAPAHPGAALDPRISTSGREGLTSTAPANVYKSVSDPDHVTVPPDGRPHDQQPAWRKDFPIDWPQDHYVARRDFTKFMVLTSFAFFFGQVWIGMQNWWRRREGRPAIRRIASLGELAIGQSIVFYYPEEEDNCILIRPSQDVLLAYSQKCTHLSCAVTPRPEEGVIYCPCHAGYFDLHSGRPIAGPPQRPLPRILLELRGDDVYATDVEWRTV